MLNKTDLFAAPKGDGIRIVYDATKCLLTASLWCPSFYLPGNDYILQNADSSPWFGDIGLG